MTQTPQDAVPTGPSDSPLPGQGEPPSTPPGAGGTLVVDVNLYRGIRRAKANIYLDGVRVVNRKGPNAYSVAPGLHMVSAEVNAMGRTFGQADLQAQVAPGQTTTIYYASPTYIDRPGALGFQPTEHPGSGRARATRGCLIAVLVVLVLLVVLIAISFASFRGAVTPDPSPSTSTSVEVPPTG